MKLISISKCLLVAGSIVVSAGLARASAAGLECPLPIHLGTPPSVTKEVGHLLSQGNPIDDPAQLSAAVDLLRKNGVRTALVVDRLLAAYCPLVAADTSLSEDQKVSRMRQFACQITAIVYEIEDTTRVLVSVPLKPETLDEVRARAEATHSTVEAWIAKAIDGALQRE